MSLTVKIKGDASQFEKTMRGVKSTVGGLSSKIAGIGAAAAGAAAGYLTLTKAMEFLQSSSSKAADMEDLTIQMGMLAGSTEKARQMIKIFRDEAAKSPLSSEDYAKAAKTLMAFGMSADDSLPIMRSLADISMGNSERFESLAIAFAQTTSAGRLMGQEVLQFVNAGFNPLQQISLRTGESMATLKKRMEDGGISAKEVTQAFIDATSAGGKFYKAIELGANTTNAKIAQTKDNVDKLQIAFGTGFNEGLKDALDATNTFLPKLEKKFSDAGKFIGFAITEALSGNSKKFELAGELIGAIIASGIKVGFKRGLIGAVEEMYVGILEQSEIDANRQLSSEIATKAEKEKDPEKKRQMMRDAQAVLNRKSVVRDMYQEGEAYSRRSDSFSAGFRSELQALVSSFRESESSNIAKNLGAGFNQNLTGPMMAAFGPQTMSYKTPDAFDRAQTISDAVTDGVLKAWVKQPQMAKFSN